MLGWSSNLIHQIWSKWTRGCGPGSRQRFAYTNMHHTMHRPIHGAACPSPYTQSDPHPTHKKRDYMILLLIISRIPSQHLKYIKNYNQLSGQDFLVRLGTKIGNPREINSYAPFPIPLPITKHKRKFFKAEILTGGAPCAAWQRMVLNPHPNRFFHFPNLYCLILRSFFAERKRRKNLF